MTKSPILVLMLLAIPASGQQQQLPGRYFTPDTLVAQLNNAATKNSADSYLIGVYDLTQQSGQSCALRGTTTPAQVEQVFSNYLTAHPDLMHADRTAASVAAQAFSEYWPCSSRPSQTAPQVAPTSQAPAANAITPSRPQPTPQGSAPSSPSGPAKIAVQVRDAFSIQQANALGYSQVARTNVQLPAPYTADNRGQWSFTCDTLLSHGDYEATYDQGKDRLQIVATDAKGKLHTTTCHLFLKEWREPR